ncbi:sensor histidine kinase [Pontibacillus salicampi]|uniref:histidine kinase n=1 Tax=Pontibacillus salicampi TaxID=1449801 RepID=A0ABV6LKA6_9BACI
MKLFLREQLPLLIMVPIQLLLTLLIYSLAGFHDWMLGTYAIFIGLIVLSAYLVYTYSTHKEYYRRLSTPVTSLDESTQSHGQHPVPQAFDHRFLEQYNLYQQEMAAFRSKQERHLTFINQWVHQTKTPLSVIELLLQDDGELKKESMQEELDKLKQGLTTALYLARLQSFRHDFQVERVSLCSMVREVIQDNKRFFLQNDIYPDMHIKNDVDIFTDKKWFTFTLSQVVINAIKYSNNPHQRVTIRTLHKDTYIELQVIDRGVGIPLQDINRVFEPFYTGENGRHYTESTGMGLYLVKEVIESLDHKCYIESQPGKGTTFSFVIYHWEQ